VDSFPPEHVLFNILNFNLTYGTIIDILYLYQYQSVITARTPWR
jgi:hypothetical protein